MHLHMSGSGSTEHHHHHHNMPFSGLFKKKSEATISVASRTPSLLSRRSTKDTTTTTTTSSGHSITRSRSRNSPQQSVLVPPSFPSGNVTPPALSRIQSPTLISPVEDISTSSRTLAPPTNEPPPAYTERPTSLTVNTNVYGNGSGNAGSALSAPRRSDVSQASKTDTTMADDPYAFLSTFDTVFVIDDSGSMAGRSWNETSQALAAIAPICASHDSDGVEVVFMNTRQRASHRNLKNAADVRRAFDSTRPGGGTPTGATLDSILRPYLRDLEARGCEHVKPLNMIVITDGVPTDDPESVIIQAARRLDRLDCPAWQVGIQFFQVGREPGAAEALAELDDGLVDLGCPRDIVDTVPWRGQLSAQGMLKVVLGAVNRRLDRRRASSEAAR